MGPSERGNERPAELPVLEPLWAFAADIPCPFPALVLLDNKHLFLFSA